MKKGMKLQLDNPIFIVKSHSYQFHRLIFHQKYQKLRDFLFRYNDQFVTNRIIFNQKFQKVLFLRKSEFEI